MVFALSGCGSVFSRNVGSAVEFRENGKPVTLSMGEYISIRGDVTALLAERNLAFADVAFHAPMIAIIEVKTDRLSKERTMAAVKIVRVVGNPKVSNLSPGMAGYWVSPSNQGPHPSLTLMSSVGGYDRSYTDANSSR